MQYIDVATASNFLETSPTTSRLKQCKLIDVAKHAIRLTI